MMHTNEQMCTKIEYILSEAISMREKLQYNVGCKNDPVLINHLDNLISEINYLKQDINHP